MKRVGKALLLKVLIFSLVLTTGLTVSVSAGQPEPTQPVFNLADNESFRAENLSIKYKEFFLELEKGIVVPINRNNEASGLLLSGTGSYQYLTKEGKTVVDRFNNALFIRPGNFDQIDVGHENKISAKDIPVKEYNLLLRRALNLAGSLKGFYPMPVPKGNMLVYLTGEELGETIIEEEMINRFERTFVFSMNKMFIHDMILPVDFQPADTRTEKWRQDLDLLCTILPLFHKNAFHNLNREEFEREGELLRSAVPKLSDEEIIVGMKKLVAMIGDEHTNLYHTSDRLYPLSLYWLKDGFYVIKTPEPYCEALKTKLTKINGHDINGIFKEIRDLIPHANEAQVLNTAPNYLISSTILSGLKVIDNPSFAPFTFEDASGNTFTVELNISSGSGAKWVSAFTGIPLPLCLKNTGRYYWFEYMEEEETLYFQYNSCRNDPNYPFSEFIREMETVMESHPVEKFVIDLRFNGGGSSVILDPLIDELQNNPEINKKGHLFVIVGRNTFSSAILNAVSLRNKTNALFYGEPTGGKPNHFGQVRRFILPNSGLMVTYSTKYFTHSKEDTPSFIPDVVVETSSEDFFSGKDPVLEEILKI